VRIARVRSIGEWAVFAALILLGSSVFSYGNKDSPVISTGGADAGTGIVEGIAGQITDSRGRPVAGAFIQPRALDDPSPPVPEIAIVSDGDGRYTWRLFPGTYEISVSAEGYRGISKQATVKPRQQVTMDFTLERAQ
jgi:hypothetical protein